MRRPYDSKLWRDLRVQILERDGHRCRVCGEPAVAVDHLIPWREAPNLAFDPMNLRAICVFHNSSRVKRPNRVGESQRRPSRDW